MILCVEFLVTCSWAKVELSFDQNRDVSHSSVVEDYPLLEFPSFLQENVFGGRQQIIVFKQQAIVSIVISFVFSALPPVAESQSRMFFIMTDGSNHHNHRGLLVIS